MADIPSEYDDIGIDRDVDSLRALSPQQTEVFNNVVQNLNVASGYVNEISDPIFDAVGNALDGSDILITSHNAELTGSIDNALQDLEMGLGKTANALMTPPDNTLYRVMGDLVQNGIGVPSLPADMATDLEDETGEWILQRLSGDAGPLQAQTAPIQNETIAPFTGETEQSPVNEIPPTVPPISQSPSEPLPTGALPTVPPNTPPSPPPPPLNGALLTPTVCGVIPIRQGCRLVGNSLNNVSVMCDDPPDSPPLSPEGNSPGNDRWSYANLGVQSENGYVRTMWEFFCGPSPAPPAVPPVPPTVPELPEPSQCPTQQCCPPQTINVTVPPVTIEQPKEPKEPGGKLEPSPLPPPNPDPPVFKKGLCWGDQLVCGVDGVIQKLETEKRLAATFKPSSFETFVSGVWGSVVHAVTTGYAVVSAGIAKIMGTDPQEAIVDAQKKVGSTALGAMVVDGLMAGPVGYCLPNPTIAVNLGNIIALMNSAEDQSGVPMSYLGQSIIYEFQYANPQYIPTQPEINAHYLTNQITAEEWACYTKAHGNHPLPFKRTINASQTRPGVNELIQLHLRKEITLDDLKVRLREIGVLDTKYVSDYLRLANFIPPYTDIIRMMVRDSADDNVAKQYNYDKDFELKFSPVLQQWAESQGIEPLVAKYLWRAHWQIPSNTALYEMMQRLRPDRPEVVQYEIDLAKWAAQGGAGPEPVRPLIFTLKDVQQAIEVNDMAPAFVPALLEIAYRPLTRIDAQRGFEIGTLSAEDLYNSLRDNGYNEKNARILVQFYSQQKSRRNANATGVWSIRKVLNEYKKGTVSYQGAVQLLQPLMPNGQEIANALTGADQEVKSQVVGNDIKRWKRAYFTGSIDSATANDKLLALGMDTTRAADLIAMWESDRQGRYKEPTVQLLHKWAMTGIITSDDMYLRLLRLGYSDIDATRIVYSAQYDINVAAQKEYEKLAREAEKRFKDKLKFRKDSEEELQKKIDDWQKALEKAQKEMDKRNKSLGLNGQN